VKNAVSFDTIELFGSKPFPYILAVLFPPLQAAGSKECTKMKVEKISLLWAQPF
jgi:hypothetical protein